MTAWDLTPEEVQFDMAEWVSSEMAVVERHGPSEWTCTCPACGAEKLAVNVHRKAYQCWSCTFAGRTPRRLVAEVMGVTWEQALQIIAAETLGIRDLGRRIQALEEGDNTATRPGAIPTAPPPPGMLDGLDGPTAAYAHSRGIPSDHAYLTGLRAVQGDGSGSLGEWMLKGRLLIPVWDLHGRFVYWVARATDGHEIKTVNLPEPCNGLSHPKGPPCRGTPDCTCKHERWGLSPTPWSAGKAECLCGQHLLARGEPAYLVEGPIDYAVCGPGFVATMGAKLSAAQAAILVRAGVSEVVILFDGDKAGRIGAEKARVLLEPLVPVRVAECPTGSDPGSLGRSRCLELADRATTGGIVAPLRSVPSQRDYGAIRQPAKPFIEKLSD